MTSASISPEVKKDMCPDIQKIETERLTGEAVNLGHWPIWKAMGANAELMATLGGTWDESTAFEKLEYNINAWDSFGFGQWMFFDKVTNEFIGRCGIRNMLVDGILESELGYSVMPHFWRQGYATEMATKVLDIGFNVLNLNRIVAFTLKTNIASIRTMQRLGFEFEKEILRGSQEHVLYKKQV